MGYVKHSMRLQSSKLLGLFYLCFFFSLTAFAWEFTGPETVSEAVEHPEIQLRRSIGIPYKAFLTEYNTHTDGGHLSKSDMLSFEFGKLSKESFNTLQETYHGEKTVVSIPLCKFS